MPRAVLRHSCGQCATDGLTVTWSCRSSELGLDKPESERTGEGGDEESAAEPEADADGEDDEDEEEDSDVEDDVEAK